MGLNCSNHESTGGINEQVKHYIRHSDKHEAPKQPTSESMCITELEMCDPSFFKTEVQTTAVMKNWTLEANTGDGPSNQSGGALKTSTNKPSKASTNPEDQRNVTRDDDFKGHSSSKSKTAEWQFQYTRPNVDARIEYSSLSEKDAKDALISATPSTSRKEDRVESVNRPNVVARIEDCSLSEKDAKDALISATPSTSRKEDRVESVNRLNDVLRTTKMEENHATDSTNDRKKMQEYEREVERLQAEVIKLTQEKDTLLNRQAADGLEQQNEDRENKHQKTKEKKRHDDVSYTTQTEENHATDSANDRNKMQEYDKKIDSLEADVMKLRRETTLLNRLTPDGLEKQHEDRKKKPHKTKEEKRHDDLSYTTNTDENHATDSTIDRKKFHEYERQVGCLEAEVIKLREEKDKLLNRLSEIGSLKLTENNTKVTDLSDENRPEKVVEQLSEIYDNEWTDAYENLTKRQCKQMDWSVKQLLDVLKETYTICLSSTQEKNKALKEAISNYLGLSGKEATVLDLKETKKRIQEHRKKMFQGNITIIEKKVRDRLEKKLEKEIYECLSDYIGKCVIVCWNMCSKEPPMYLDFGDWKQTAQSGDENPANMPFDKLKFVTYTKSGVYIDYVVWPAVYICEGGPLMRKGVAQGSGYITDKIEKIENENES